ncbi:hypothetical protein OEZ86_011981 [Tetradesmus obliquus]|nr:hypothetical protein OEZ86_011981 [Tetradesmus obliquus]
MAAGPTPPVHKSCSRGVTSGLCLVEGCTVDLSGPDVKPYCWKRQLCMEHMRAQAVRRKGCGNTLFRFCQQCGKLEQLARFQGQKSAGPGLAAAAALMMPYAAALPALCDVACGPAACGSEAQLPQALNDWLDMEAERLVGEVMGTAAGAAVTVQQQAQHAQQQQQQRLPLETCQAIARSLMAMEQQLQQQQQQHQHQQQPTLQLQACCSMPLAW